MVVPRTPLTGVVIPVLMAAPTTADKGQRRQAQGRLGAGHGLPPVPLDGLIGMRGEGGSLRVASLPRRRNHIRADVQRHFARLGQESYRAGLDMALFALPQPRKVKPTPMLILGAENDTIFTRAEEKATARAYNAQVEFFPNMAHDMMLEPGWQKVAERIVAWLKEKGL